MKIIFQAFIKQYTQKGLVSGDKSHRLLLSDLQIAPEMLSKLAAAPTDKPFAICLLLEDETTQPTA